MCKDGQGFHAPGPWPYFVCSKAYTFSLTLALGVNVRLAMKWLYVGIVEG